jgi:hypothetical protein
MSVVNVDLTSQIDGITNVFTVTQPKASGFPFVVFQNGQKNHESEVTALTSTSFSLGFIPQVGENLEVQYQDNLSSAQINCTIINTKLFAELTMTNVLEANLTITSNLDAVLDSATFDADLLSTSVLEGTIK